ncbi:MAG: flippase-like domain-containing protein [Verrucomicrobia bacterium]|nr:flippase-like domain-containing protein [Verrucomicrobiota bacterium]
MKLTFVVGLLAFLIQKIELDNLRDVVQHIEPQFFVWIFLLWGLEASVRTYNWGLLLRCKEIKLPFPKLFYAYITGSFFGYFVPSSFGTDVSRFIALSRQTPVRMADAALSVLALNLVSLLSLACTLCISALVLTRFLDQTLLLLFLSLAAGGGLVVFALLVRFRETLRRAFPPQGKLEKPITKIWSLIDAFRVFENHPALLLKVFGISLLIQIIAAMIVYTLAAAIQSDVQLLFIFLFMPVIAISRLIPLSIANLGAEQGIFVFLFSFVGVSEAESFTISLLLSTSAMIFILFGGLVHFFIELIRSSRNRSSRTRPYVRKY